MEEIDQKALLSLFKGATTSLTYLGGVSLNCPQCIALEVSHRGRLDGHWRFQVSVESFQVW